MSATGHERTHAAQQETCFRLPIYVEYLDVTPAMTIEITDWLRKLGLEQYASAFRDNRWAHLRIPL